MSSTTYQQPSPVQARDETLNNHDLDDSEPTQTVKPPLVLTCSHCCGTGELLIQTAADACLKD